MARFHYRGEKRRASALLIVLWAIMTMSAAVLGVVGYLHYNLDEARALNVDFELRQLAQSGLAFAFSQQVLEGDPILSGKIGDQEGGYEVVLHSETARLNINRLLRTGQEEILERLFEEWKVPSSDAKMVIQDLIKWMGRTGTTAADFAVEREFRSVDEMLNVETMAKVEARHPEWQDAFTTWGNGRLDINDATQDVVKAFFGIGDRAAERIVQSRLGPDKLEHTLDDEPYTDKTVLARALGFTDKQFAPFIQHVSFETQLTRAESTGILGDKRRQIRVIFNRKVQPPVIYQWQEVPL